VGEAGSVCGAGGESGEATARRPSHTTINKYAINTTSTNRLSSTMKAAVEHKAKIQTKSTITPS